MHLWTDKKGTAGGEGGGGGGVAGGQTNVRWLAG